MNVPARGRGETIEKKNTFRINRRLDPGRYPLADVFPDIRTYGVLSAIFDNEKEVDTVVMLTGVSVADLPYEMFVDNDDGSITIGLTHLRRSPDEVLYLDVIHELCHVKQHLQGRDLYDRSKAYVDRETEIEAYEVTVREARRIGLDDDAILDYLRVSWITPEEHKRLARKLDVKESTQKE
ncbi:MAG: hypothetical protein JRE40_02165 [Deltaproteobacteria bacterium]|nr:hypothetical protein [Deltaproteobacteria bacterium]